jgi:hypothetical protein
MQHAIRTIPATMPNLVMIVGGGAALGAGSAYAMARSYEETQAGLVAPEQSAWNGAAWMGGMLGLAGGMLAAGVGVGLVPRIGSNAAYATATALVGTGLLATALGAELGGEHGRTARAVRA